VAGVCRPGAHLLWRVPANRILDVEQALPDGSWLSSMYAAGDRPAQRRPVRVRVVAGDLDELAQQCAGEYRLVTDLLDHSATRPRELAARYPNGGKRRPRWMNSRPTSAALAWC
jgi:hypothetical protein